MFSFPQHTILLRNQSITLPIQTNKSILYLQNEFGVTILENNLKTETKETKTITENTQTKTKKVEEVKKIKQKTENIDKKENIKKENKATEKDNNNFFSIKDKRINLTVTKENFWIWVSGLILVSFLIISPLLFEVYRSKKNKKQK